MTCLGFGQGSSNHHGFAGPHTPGSCTRGPACLLQGDTEGWLPDFTHEALGSPARPPTPQPAGRGSAGSAPAGVLAPLGGYRPAPDKQAHQRLSRQYGKDRAGESRQKQRYVPPQHRAATATHGTGKGPGRRVTVETQRRKRCAAPGSTDHARRK